MAYRAPTARANSANSALYVDWSSMCRPPRSVISKHSRALAELVARDPKARGDRERPAVDQLGDPGAAHRPQVVADAAVGRLRDQDVAVEPEPAEGRAVKVVPVLVGEVDEVRVELLHQAVRHR